MSVESKLQADDRRRDFVHLSIESWYQSGTRDLVSDFYRPCLERSIRYDRTTGYFDTRALALVPDAVARFVENGGRMRLIASPRIRTPDVTALRADVGGFDADRLPRVGDDDFRRTFAELMRTDRFAATAWLVDRGVLEVRIAYVTESEPYGHYHEKCGIFADRQGNRLAFAGSVNETGMAWKGNHESFEVFRSWKSADRPRLERRETLFRDLWTDNVDGLSVVPLEDAVERGVGVRSQLTSMLRTAVTRSLRRVRSNSTG